MLYFGHGTSTSLSPQLLGLHSLAVRTSHEATTQPVSLDFRKCLLATFMDVATRKFIRHLDLRAWPSGDIGGVDGEGGDEEGGESDAEEHDDKHGGTFHTLNDLRKPEIFVSGKIDISPTSQSGKLRPAWSDSQSAQGLCLPSVPLALPSCSGPLRPLTPAFVLQSPRWPARWRGLRSLFPKMCRVALPLQLLFLLLLLFLLPVGEDSRSCSMVNNFARSFRLMLRYSGPPPT